MSLAASSMASPPFGHHSHALHLHQVQCTAACLGWHMAVHRLLGVSPVWAEGQVAGRLYPMLAVVTTL